MLGDEDVNRKTNMEESDSDWRLAGQENWLQGIRLKLVEFRKREGREDWDHEHCEFCWQKIVERADVVKYDAEVICEAYCDEVGCRWICPTCFRDFQERFDWQLTEKI